MTRTRDLLPTLVQLLRRLTDRSGAYLDPDTFVDSDMLEDGDERYLTFGDCTDAGSGALPLTRVEIAHGLNAENPDRPGFWTETEEGRAAWYFAGFAEGDETARQDVDYLAGLFTDTLDDDAQVDMPAPADTDGVPQYGQGGEPGRFVVTTHGGRRYAVLIGALDESGADR